MKEITDSYVMVSWRMLRSDSELTYALLRVAVLIGSAGIMILAPLSVERFRYRVLVRVDSDGNTVLATT